MTKTKTKRANPAVRVAAPLDPGLRAYGTPTQRKLYDLLLENGNDYGKAAEAMGWSSRDAARAEMSKLRARAAKKGYAPEAGLKSPIPEGYAIKGVSRLERVDAEGNPTETVMQWVKTDRDKEDTLAALREAVEALCTGIEGSSKPTPPPRKKDRASDLLTVYPIGDHHFGMLAWAAETGSRSWDLNLAETALRRAFDGLVACAPITEEALVVSAGDLHHADNRQGTTEKGTRLDVDSRWGKVQPVSIRCLVYSIDLAKTKAKTVRVRIEAGNHDPHSALMLAWTLDAWYRNDPRVIVETDPNPFWRYRFGKVLLATTHGDGIKRELLPGIMASDWPEDWGKSEFRHWYTGHLHHRKIEDFGGATVQVLRVLPPRDYWHHKKGYRSPSAMTFDVWHRERGRVSGHEVSAKALGL